MPGTATVDLRSVAQVLGMPEAQVASVVELLDAGNTVPFITRYRKDQTGGLDEEQIRAIQARVEKLRLLADRRQTILRSIESQSKLTPELAASIAAAESSRQLEDLYLPFKPKKQTLATLARSRGLELLAAEILRSDPAAENLDARAADFVNPDRQVQFAADALLGAGHILAEEFSERADLRGRLRTIVEQTGKLASTRAEPAETPKPEHNGFRDYFEYAEALGKVPPHRVLAINRGERAKALRVRIDADIEAMHRAIDDLLFAPDHPHAEFLRGCARDALQRLILPSLERDFRRELTDHAEAHAVQVFARNLRNLLLQPPVRGERVLAIDPGFKSGCKLAALDAFGNLLDKAVVFLIGKEERRAEATARLVEMATTHELNVVAIGNGTACRETEQWIAELIAGPLAERRMAYVIVNEAGASVYSTSRLGREEFPEYDATLRSAISIGRRLQDPLSELVKIDPANIGVGMYQHDVKAKHLQESLDAVVESCVNFVGVELNTASPALLRYVSGLNQLTAQRVYEHRLAHGPFLNREQLRAVQGIGEASYVQAAGFLKIVAGENPLDGTWIHPESYDVAQAMLAQLEAAVADLAEKESASRLAERVGQLDLPRLSAERNVGVLTLQDIAAQLARPGRDPRESLPPPIFKHEVLKLEHLSAGMELAGTVLNVVDFGAFIDIGLKDSGLVHISQLADKFVPDPHQVVSVGDVVKVWVLGVDKERRRVSLTMIDPAVRQAAEERRAAQQARKDAERLARQKAAEQARAAAPPAARAATTGGPPKRGGGPRGGAGSGRPQRESRPTQPPPKPKPLVPLSKSMKEGKEPLRTFGDLLQFIQLQKEADKPADAGE